MGAHDFSTIIYGIDNLREAYAAACDQAIHEHGHDSYNGTISTTHGVTRSPLASTPMREDQIDWQAVSERRDHLSKWENCEALPIKQVKPARHRSIGSVEVEARVPSDVFTEGITYEARQEMLEQAFVREARKALKEGRTLTSPRRYWGSHEEVTSRDVTDLKALAVGGLTVVAEERAQRVTTRATPGNVVTRYFILHEGLYGRMPSWESGYATQAEARAHLPKTLNDRTQMTQMRMDCEIISMSRRSSGEALVTHQVAVNTTSKTVPARISGQLSERIEEAQETGVNGWLFYGLAAS